MPTIPSAFKIAWLERVEGRDIHKIGLLLQDITQFPSHPMLLRTAQAC